VQSAFVVHDEPYVTAALVSEPFPPSPPLPPPSPPPLPPPSPPPVAPLELPELLDELPDELPAAPLLLELAEPLLLPVDEPPLEPLPPELEPGLMPGDVCPPELEFWEDPVLPPVSSELHAHRQRARAAIAAAVGPMMDVRRIVWAPIASTGPCAVLTSRLHTCSHVARSPGADVAMSPVGDVPLDHLLRRLTAQLHLQ